MLTIALVLGSTLCVYGQDTSNFLFTGGIDVKQEVYQVKNGKKQGITYTDIYAGQERSYVVDITNKLNEAYIRVSTTTLLDGKRAESMFTGISGDWIKKGDYYYYTRVLKHKEKVNFCSGLLVDSNIQAESMDIIVKTEAVQAYGINPDFSSDNPFKGIPIESTKVDGNLRQIDPKENVVEFDNTLSAIIDNRDFFSGFGALMPGQTVSDSFKVINNSDKLLRIKMYLTDDSLATTPNMNKVGLNIKKNGVYIFKGTLYDETLRGGLTLGIFNKGIESEFEFEIEVPTDLTNADAMQSSLVKWRFDSEYVRYAGGGSSGGGGGSRPTGGVGGSSGGGPSGGGSGTGGLTTIKDNQVALNKIAIDNVMYDKPDASLSVGITGEWELIDQEKHLWKFKFSNGAYASDGWIYVRNPYYNNLSEYSWYHFDGEYMSWGWIKGEGDIWYYGHDVSDGDLGTLVKGWHHDTDDGRDYYLDPITGIMHSGWSKIDGKWYYFAKITDTYKQNWFWNTALGRWLYDMLGDRPYGSMYTGETTPDGYYVNDNGVWKGER